MAVIPMFPLGSVLLPGEQLPLHIFEPRYQEMLRDCLTTEDPSFGVVLIERGHEAGGGDARHDIATMAHIVAHQDIGDGRHIVECIGAERIRVDAWLEDDPYPRADARKWPDDDAPVPDAEFDALHEKIRELYHLIGKLAEAEGSEPPGEPAFSELPAGAGERLFTLASMVPMGQSDRQDILKAPSASTRIAALTDGLDNITDIVRFRLQ
ncbi:LON peptidase substrate-binding domain-containing protein [Rhodococcus sp. G-MC3]|uniref:LON peptidase substrate-binding domain-containing protein n=1 Tax=Rhodococcus sp. G-MC3 TaxID=3046209 RepID=UPI0024BA7E9F|nr:LON peptidase substrate-binding domain-containing protein [Rhodococcus sp. G-MC3]MDJ0393763.1 LON peptidase substrate-binding domain-containing protein [Rhodococcus sp. G-MC3]